MRYTVGEVGKRVDELANISCDDEVFLAEAGIVSAHVTTITDGRYRWSHFAREVVGPKNGCSGSFR